MWFTIQAHLYCLHIPRTCYFAVNRRQRKKVCHLDPARPPSGSLDLVSAMADPRKATEFTPSENIMTFLLACVVDK